VQLDFHLARERFSKAGIPLDSRDLAMAQRDFTLALRLTTLNDRDTGKLVLSAALYNLSPHLGLTDAVYSESITLSVGLHAYQIRALVNAVNAPPHTWSAFIGITHQLYTCHLVNDALSTVLDPLALLPDGRWVAFGGTLHVDPNAYFRQPETALLMARHDHGGRDEIALIALDGTITIVSNGAGVGMLLIDAIHSAGGAAAALIDTGMMPVAETLESAFTSAITLVQTRVILLHLVIALADQHTFAKVIQSFVEHLPAHVFCVVDLSGITDEIRATLEVTAATNMIIASDTRDAVRHAVSLAT